MFTATPPIEPIEPAYHVRILNDEQLQRFQTATLQILERTGIHCPSTRALNLYAEHGAEVDFDSQIVRLPAQVIFDAMAHAPRHYTMGGRSEAFDLDLSRSYFIGDALCDIATGLAVGCRPILVLTGLGQQQLPRLIEEGYSSYRVAADLMEAVELILAGEGYGHG